MLHPAQPMPGQVHPAQPPPVTPVSHSTVQPGNQASEQPDTSIPSTAGADAAKSVQNEPEDATEDDVQDLLDMIE